MSKKAIGPFVEPRVPGKDKGAWTVGRIPFNEIGGPAIDLIVGNRFLNSIEPGCRFIRASAWCFFIAAAGSFVIEGEEVTAAEMSRDDDPSVILAELDSEGGGVFFFSESGRLLLMVVRPQPNFWADAPRRRTKFPSNSSGG